MSATRRHTIGSPAALLDLLARHPELRRLPAMQPLASRPAPRPATGCCGDPGQPAAGLAEQAQRALRALTSADRLRFKQALGVDEVVHFDRRGSRLERLVF